MKKCLHILLIIFVLICIPVELFSQQKTAFATRISQPPKIDGLLTDTCWALCDSVGDFYQYEPIYNIAASQKTVVRIAYDDEAVYIAARMYDTAPDSILKELGNRDDDDLNADKFGVEFDTYNMQTDAYTFMVWASGVQLDYRKNDETYSGVWHSAVKIHDWGWACEMKINYSALRFPKLDDQVWGLQIFRGIRRHREMDKWALEVKSSGNCLLQWGKLRGITGVKAPLRLSITPFISLYADHYPYNIKGQNNFSYSFSGGLDLKYGISECFTIDVTLLPDFSQVQSDYQVKNISAFETVYEEHRPFFTEAIDLFTLGDLFYTRRIGREPQGHYSVEDSLQDDEFIYKNPGQAKLLNAIKISGRNKNGTAIGVFNAITNNTYATVKDSLGNKRKILTEPLTNYNIFVFDQILKNNSKIYFVNTNVIRSRKYDDANVSLLGFNLNDRKNIFQIAASAALSQKFYVDSSENLNYKNNLGYKYDVSFNKISGRFQFSVYRNEMNHTYDANDMGLVLQNNITTTGATFKYNIYEPFWRLRHFYNTLNIYHTENFLAKRVEEFQIEYTGFLTTKKYLSITGTFTLSPLFVNNFHETRTPGRFFVMDRWFLANAFFSTDYRKTFAIDITLDYWQEINGDGIYYGITLNPIIVPTDNFAFDISCKYEGNYNDIGFVYNDDIGNIIMGKRDIITVENQLNARYVFKKDLSLSLQLRHYWAKGMYDQHYKLDNDGILITDPLLPLDKQYNFNFNAFNIDLMFYWEFAPGSSLHITYKNNIAKDSQIIVPSYFRNFRKIFYEKQLNSLSVKVLYYLDYQQVKRFIKKKKNHHDKSY
ncbi:MAG: DUF5916 domain-containing protein [Bacteroidales bacterium]|nr:carbohydrate binding family 9 domain-containing protein [Bacteroidales bacterium]MDD4213883.1 DUF5916 domain-containing protein [Bacteroidales bacterium]